MNEKDIQYVLGKHLFLNNVCIPNVSMYCPGHTEYEADFVYFSMKTQFLTEVEIKTNFQDFKDDFNKKGITTVKMSNICTMRCLELSTIIIVN